MNTAERRVQFLSAVQMILPALTEMLIQPEPPKPRREHKVIAYNFIDEKEVDLTPPAGDGWTLAEVNLHSGLAHWTRVVLIDAEFEEKSETIPSAPPEPETSPAAAPEPMVPCLACGQYPHASTCTAK